MNSNKYDVIIRRWTSNYKIPFHLFKALIYCESSFIEFVISRCGAAGLTQLMPSVYKPEGIDPLDPVDNIRVGCSHLKRMYNIFGNEKGIERWKYALGSYNGGAGYIINAQAIAEKNNAKIDKWYHIVLFLKEAKWNGKSCDYLQVAEYVDKVISKMYDYVLEHVSRKMNIC